MQYNYRMKYELISTEIFDKWFDKIDRATRNQLLSRLSRIECGNFGDHKIIDQDLFELRCFFGGGIRIYYTIRNQQIVLLLVGGKKDNQTKDIENAKKMFKEEIGD